MRYYVSAGEDDAGSIFTGETPEKVAMVDRETYSSSNSISPAGRCTDVQKT